MWRSISLSQKNFTKPIYDVVVVGGGHAGCEGAVAAARCGANTLLITHKLSSVGVMSCNPSFGGIGKGHLIREIDALDGLCGRICDKSAITYQALNLSKGPAVLGLRAQIDRDLYRNAMQKEIFYNTPNLNVLEGAVEDLKLEESLNSSYTFSHRILGCILADGTEILTKCILITTGTFLNGEIFQGLESRPAGRIGDSASNGLSKTFNRLGFELGRLRTKTPPRLIGSTIDFSKFEIVPPDKNPIPFSFLTKKVWLSPEKQRPTYIGYTNAKTNKIVLDNLHENLYLEAEVHGPRNCPSLESRVTKFPNLIQHRIFLEHEGLDNDIIYPQSMSLSFSPKIQLDIMRTVLGLENVEFQQAGYGVHYDFVNPQQLNKSLETKKVEGLFLAGQINGTTGYEEAAAQGIIAGINSALKAENYTKGPLLIDRSQGYIGVLIDDLTSLGTIEPYRMFTSKVEFRINLRPDNADFRLTEMGKDVGAISTERFKSFKDVKERYIECVKRLKSISMSAEKWNKTLPCLNAALKPKGFNGFEILSRYNIITLNQLAKIYPNLFEEFSNDMNLEERIRNEGRYSLYQIEYEHNVDLMRKETQTLLPDNLDYLMLEGLSSEGREKLHRFKPKNIAAASRIPGVTINDLIILLRYAKRQ